MNDDTKLILSRGFDAGNYAAAYVSTDYMVAFDADTGPKELEAYCAAFVLGFFSSYEVHEIPEDYREMHEAAYRSKYGAAVLEAGYIDKIAEYEPPTEPQTGARTYTTCPVDYDGFGTETIRVVGRCGKGLPVRLVSTPLEHAEWQRNRYYSGGIYLVADALRWQELVDYKLVDVTGKDETDEVSTD